MLYEVFFFSSLSSLWNLKTHLFEFGVLEQNRIEKLHASITLFAWKYVGSD